MNVFYKEPEINKIASMLFYGWNKGLKTGCYYLRTLPKASTNKFDIDTQNKKKNRI